MKWNGGICIESRCCRPSFSSIDIFFFIYRVPISFYLLLFSPLFFFWTPPSIPSGSPFTTRRLVVSHWSSRPRATACRKMEEVLSVTPFMEIAFVLQHKQNVYRLLCDQLSTYGVMLVYRKYLFRIAPKVARSYVSRWNHLEALSFFFF